MKKSVLAILLIIVGMTPVLRLSAKHKKVDQKENAVVLSIGERRDIRAKP